MARMNVMSVWSALWFKYLMKLRMKQLTKTLPAIARSAKMSIQRVAVKSTFASCLKYQYIFTHWFGIGQNINKKHTYNDYSVASLWNPDAKRNAFSYNVTQRHPVLIYQSQCISQINTAKPVNTAYSGSLFWTSCSEGWYLPLAAIEQSVMSSHMQQKKRQRLHIIISICNMF